MVDQEAQNTSGIPLTTSATYSTLCAIPFPLLPYPPQEELTMLAVNGFLLILRFLHPPFVRVVDTF